MTTDDRLNNNEDKQAQNGLPTNTPDEASELDKRLAELRAQGIVSGGDGPRETLRPVARVPGALERFLKARD